MGVNDASGNWRRSLLQFGAYLLVFAPAIVIDSTMRRARIARHVRTMTAAIYSVALGFVLWHLDIGWDDVFRGVPLLLLMFFTVTGLPKLHVDNPQPWTIWHLLTAKAELVHSPESSVWRRHTSGGKFVPAHAWLRTTGADGDEAAAHLVHRYLAAFGPAARADVAQWTGVTLAALEPGFARLTLRRFRDEQGRELLDVPRAPLPAATVPAPARFLPTWDSTLLAYVDRTRILPEEYRKVVIRKNGDVQQTFLVDGFVAGLWQIVDGRVELKPFEPLPARVRRELEQEAGALAAFHW